MLGMSRVRSRTSAMEFWPVGLLLATVTCRRGSEYIPLYNSRLIWRHLKASSFVFVIVTQSLISIRIAAVLRFSSRLSFYHHPRTRQA